MSEAGDIPAATPADTTSADERATISPTPAVSVADASADGRSGLLVLSASPFARGRCDRAARHAVQEAQALGWAARVLFLRDYQVLPCRGCNVCARVGAGCIVRGDQLPELADEIDKARALLLVSPVFFAGPPSQLKAMFDRLQPLWAARRAGSVPVQTTDSRRPLWLLAIGSGGDPFGMGPLSECSHSALRMLGFELRGVTKAIGMDTDPGDAELLTAGAHESLIGLKDSLAAFPPKAAAPLGAARTALEWKPRPRKTSLHTNTGE